MTFLKFNLKNSLLKVFNLIFLITLCFIFYFALFNPFNKNISLTATFFIFILLIIFIYYFARLIKNLSKKSLFLISIFNFCVFLFLLSFFGYLFATSPGWDMSSIFNSSSMYANGEIKFFSTYFSKLYPNNIFITVCFTYFYKFLNLFNLDLIFYSIVLNIIVIFISAIITYILIYKLFGLQTSTLASFLFLFVTPFYTYASIFYTDTLTMVFIPLAFLLYYYFLKRDRMILSLSIGIIFAIGTALKTNIVIGFIALIIFSIFSLNSFKSLIKFIVPCIIAFILSTIFITFLCQRYINVPIKDAGLPPTHWIMMGLTDKGGFCLNDVNQSKAHGPNKKDIEHFNITTIEKRLENFGLSGYLKFLTKKVQYTWGDGTYFAPVKLSRKPIRPNHFHSYIYGKNASLFLNFSEASHSLLLFLILIGSISLFKMNKDTKFIYVFNICIFGVFLFLLIWETRSRYLVCILPLFVASASLGLNNLSALKLFKNSNI